MFCSAVLCSKILQLNSERWWFPGSLNSWWVVGCLIGCFVWLFCLVGWLVYCFLLDLWVVSLVGWSVGWLFGWLVRRWRFSVLFNVDAPSATVTSVSSKITQKLFADITDKNVKCYA